MKKLLSLLLVVVMLVLSVCSFASCGPARLAEFQVPAEGYDNSDVTITFYHTMGAPLRKVLDAAIVRFNEIYPNIHIEHEQTGGYDEVRDVIKTEIAVGAQPNMAYCYPDHVALYNLSKAVVSLDDLIASTIEVYGADGSMELLGLTEEQIADFIPGYYEEGKQFDEEGTMYTIPLSKSTELLFYNKTFFEENNLSLPTTWDELEQLCIDILAIDPNCTPLGYDSESNWFITMCEQIGSDYTSNVKGENFLYDNDANYAFVAKFRDWYQKGYVTTKALNGGAYSSDLFKATGDNPKCYMSIGSSAGAGYQRPEKDPATGEYPFECGITTIPQGITLEVNGEKKFYKEDIAVISQGPSLCIFNKANPQEVVASWLFAKFLATDVVFQADFSIASGYVPVIQSVKNDDTYATFLEDAFKVNAKFELKADTVYTVDATGAIVADVDGVVYKLYAYDIVNEKTGDATTYMAPLNEDQVAKFAEDEVAVKLVNLYEATAGGAVTAPIAGTAYKLAYNAGTDAEPVWKFAKGTLNKNMLLEVVDDSAKAFTVYLASVTGGYNMYQVNDNKTPDKADDDIIKYVNMGPYTNDFMTALAADACLKQVDYYYTSPAFNGSSTARDEVGALIQACFSQSPASGESVMDMIKRLFAESIEECEYHHPQF